VADACSHLDTIAVVDLPEQISGCEECLQTGSWWLHLRMCHGCGKIGCCDNSPNRHATRHFQSSGHALIRSAEPGENWSWCYVDELLFVLSPA
jgi:Zn-finger in ubiquitin-hydrolases and other protein